MMAKPTKYRITLTHIPWGKDQRVTYEPKEQEVYEVYDQRDWEVIFGLVEQRFERERLSALFSEASSENGLHPLSAEIGWEVA